MSYQEFKRISLFINNHGINSIMDKIAKEFNYDDYYIGTITQQYYHNPLGVISNHNCGERLFELIKEEAEEIYK